jgi:hypothetical protein
LSAHIRWRMPDGMRPRDVEHWEACIQDFFNQRSGTVELEMVLHDKLGPQAWRTEKAWRVALAYAQVGQDAGTISLNVQRDLTELLRTAGFPVDD